MTIPTPAASQDRYVRGSGTGSSMATWMAAADGRSRWWIEGDRGDRRCLAPSMAPSMTCEPNISEASQVWTPSGGSVLQDCLCAADGEHGVQGGEAEEHQRDDERAPVLSGALALAQHPQPAVDRM